MIALSLGEAEALARKAARGAGRSWGMAEEFGRAIRWLAGAGCPAMALGADLLDRTDGLARGPVPGADGALAHPGGDPLCPVALGAALSDLGPMVAPGRIGPIWAPLFVLPHLAHLAARGGQDWQLTWPGTTLWVTPKGVVLSASGAAAGDADAAWVAWAAGCAPKATPLAPRDRAICPLGAFDRLNQLAARLYAPETEARRRSGAGEATPGAD